MSYSIKVRVYQTNVNAFFSIVEKSIWHYANGGTWVETGGEHTLTIGGSGTSGMLRFVAADGAEPFWVAVGVHNSVRWVDIVTNLTGEDTCVKSLPDYYNNGNPERVKAREAQRVKWTATNASGRRISAEYSVSDGHDLELNVVIG
ncbi:fruit body lectin [Hypoxylon sp. FL1857]|nr:fruit body lectin [Hypoxylon sp. FL1857]